MSDQYIKDAMVTCSAGFHTENVSPQLLHGAIGAATEAGELLDVLKKALFYNKPVDRVNLVEELGDVMWYLAIMCQDLGVSFEDVQRINIAKLQKRYGEKFTQAGAIMRDYQAERALLEEKTSEKPIDHRRCVL